MPKTNQKAAVKAGPDLPPGNNISEWLGHRVYPSVRLDVSSFVGKSFGTCPFLSEALRQSTSCIKNENSFGVCTVNAASNGAAQDWLACPYRVISSGLVTSACQRIFGQTDVPQPVPVTLLQVPAELASFKRESPRRHIRVRLLPGETWRRDFCCWHAEVAGDVVRRDPCRNSQ
jgi:hypothetical protein